MRVRSSRVRRRAAPARSAKDVDVEYVTKTASTAQHSKAQLSNDSNKIPKRYAGSARMTCCFVRVSVFLLMQTSPRQQTHTPTHNTDAARK